MIRAPNKYEALRHLSHSSGRNSLNSEIRESHSKIGSRIAQFKWD